MKKIIILLALTLNSQVFAHGEDKYGPHKGYIRMPGSFHVELVPEEANSYTVYILDLMNKKSLMKDSSIEMKIIDSDKSQNFKCAMLADHFKCQADAKAFTTGKVTINITRSGNKSNAAVYELPLSLKGAIKETQGHDMQKM